MTCDVWKEKECLVVVVVVVVDFDPAIIMIKHDELKIIAVRVLGDLEGVCTYFTNSS